MTKNNIIDFPTTKRINKKSKKVKKSNEIITDLFKDKNENQIFLKDHATKHNKHIIPEGAEKAEIKRSDNIALSVNVDTEYTDYVGSLKKITYEELEKNNCRFETQYLRQQNFLKHKLSKTININDIKNIEDIASGLIKEISVELSHELENMKLVRNQMISTQFKHCIHNDEKIFFNPNIKHLIDEYVGKNELFYKENFHVLDYLKEKGFDVEILRINPDLPKEDFRKNFCVNEDNTKIPTCTITIFAFFLLAELNRIFEGVLLDDVLKDIRRNKIQMNKRVSTGMLSKYYPNWLIIINGIKYKLAINFADTGALQGNISFGDNLKNLEMGTDVKNLMDDYKTNMLYGLLKHPDKWKKYALGDLSVYDVYKKFSDLIKKVYEELKISEMYIPPKLTIGSTVNDINEAALLDYLGYKEREKENLDDLHALTINGSQKKIGNYTNVVGADKDKNRIREKHTGAKVAGGRCLLNRQILKATTSYALCDIDISSAYTSLASVLSYFLGNPVVQSFKRHKITLREFLKYYDITLLKRGFKLVVETKELLKFEQDLLVSFPNLRFAKSASYDKEGNITKIEYTVNTDNTETAIYTVELHNTPISWDDLNIILESWKSDQRDDFLDKVTLVSAIYYPTSFECENIQLLKEKQRENDYKDNGRFKDVMPHSWIDNEDGNLSHYWCCANFGQLLMDKIIQLRRENKKSNYTLSYLFKLIGNTIYGDAVSRHFKISNVVFASNITAMCRCAMWCTEKVLNIHQTITDGGVFWLNEVLHKYRDKLDASMLVRTYCQSKNEMSRYKKWKIKPITKNGEMIDYVDGKGWTCDGVLYEFNYKKVKPLEDNHLRLKTEFGEKHIKTKEAESLLDKELVGLKSFIKTINKLVLEHVKTQFPHMDLFNGEFNKIKTNEEGLAILDFKGEYVYDKVIGLLDFEVKNICDWAVFHGSADYMYNNTTNNRTTKMRGYESKKGLVAVKMEGDRIIYDYNYYNDISPTERFLDDIRLNSNNVSIPLCYFKTSILKINEYKKNFKRLWYYTDLLPGDTIFKFMTIPIYSMRHKFQTYKQHKNWQKYQNKLKRRGGGLGFEQFYLNDDGTIRYLDMVNEIDKHIRNGVLNPANVFDKDRNFFRDIKYKKNEKKNEIILKHIRLTTTMKNLNRIMTIGITQFCDENTKEKKNNVIILRKTLKNISSDYHNEYEDLNKYSFDFEFRDKELALAI